MKIKWDIICSVVTAVAAIVALGISVVQIRMSNKQQLFDRRLRLWVKAHGLMELCVCNRSFLEERKNGPELTNALMFIWMTNNTFLCDIGSMIDHIMQQDQRCLILAKLEEIREMSFEIRLVFKGRPAKMLSSFIADYASLLMAMYQYQIILTRLHSTAEHFNKDLEEATSAVGEERCRCELYKARRELLDSFDELTPYMVKRIVAQCRLSQFF